MVTSSNNTTIIGMDSGGGGGGSLPELPPGKKMVLSKSGKVAEENTIPNITISENFHIVNGTINNQGILSYTSGDVVLNGETKKGMLFSFAVNKKAIYDHTVGINLVNDANFSSESDIWQGVSSNPLTMEYPRINFSLLLAQVESELITLVQYNFNKQAVNIIVGALNVPFIEDDLIYLPFIVVADSTGKVPNVKIDLGTYPKQSNIEKEWYLKPKQIGTDIAPLVDGKVPEKYIPEPSKEQDITNYIAMSPNDTKPYSYGGVALGSGARAMGYGSLALGLNSYAAAGIAIGYGATVNLETTGDKLAVGEYSRCDHFRSAAFGYKATTTDAYQIQLGNSDTTPYAYQPLQVRSDRRDKANIKDNEIGLDFLLAHKSVQYQLNYRDQYLDDLFPYPDLVLPEQEGYEEYLAKLEEVKQNRKEWFANPTENTGKEGTRYHLGFIAQDVKALADKMGVDFAGLKHQLVNDGKSLDIYTLSYESYVPVIVKALQEISQKQQSLDERLSHLEQKFND